MVVEGLQVVSQVTRFEWTSTRVDYSVHDLRSRVIQGGPWSLVTISQHVGLICKASCVKTAKIFMTGFWVRVI